MNIENQIFTYLIGNKKICLEGLGGFVFEEIPSNYNTDTHTFIPPTFKLYFSENLKCNSTEFLFYFAEKNYITFQEAKKTLDSYIISIKNSLKNHDKASLGILGNLSIQDENLVFSPSEFISEIERFGFEELPVSTSQVKHKKLKISHPVKNTTVRKYIAAASLLISLLLIPSKPYNGNEASMADSFKLHNKAYTDNLNPSQEKMLNAVEKAFNIKNTLYPALKSKHKKTETSIDSKPAKPETKSKKEPAKPQAVYNQTIVPETKENIKQKGIFYGIVIGAFKNPDNANKFKSRHDSLDLQIKLVNGLYRVVAGKFDNKKEALRYRKQLASNGIHGWLSKI